MIIKVKKLFNIDTNKYEEGKTFKEVVRNRLYIVLNISYTESKMSYRIFDEDIFDYLSINKTCVVRAQDCEIVHPGIPSFWGLYKIDHSQFREGTDIYGCVLSPKKWHVFNSNEYSSYFDYLGEDPEGYKIFVEDTKKLFEMHRRDFDVDKILKGVVIEGDDYSEIMKWFAIKYLLISYLKCFDL